MGEAEEATRRSRRLLENGVEAAPSRTGVGTLSRQAALACRRQGLVAG
jgi:hypothetical protein